MDFDQAPVHMNRRFSRVYVLWAGADPALFMGMSAPAQVNRETAEWKTLYMRRIINKRHGIYLCFENRLIIETEKYSVWERSACVWKPCMCQGSVTGMYMRARVRVVGGCMCVRQNLCLYLCVRTRVCMRVLTVTCFTVTHRSRKHPCHTWHLLRTLP